MFFLLSKLLEFLLLPTVWVAVLAGMAAVRRSRGWALAAVGTLLLFGNAFLINGVLTAWELPPTPLTALHRRYPCAVVLGGFTEPGRQPADRTYTNKAADRLLHAVLLYKEGKTAQVLISGGNGSLLRNDEPEADNAARLALLCGVAPKDLLLEPRARNTRENAVFSRQMLDSLRVQDTVLVVTSAFHARRAGACFAEIGQPYRLFTADPRSAPPRYTLDVLLVPTPDALQKWQMLLHEWVGYLSYWVAGYV